MTIVLVHGFLNRGGIMRRLANHLRAAGHVCYTPSLKPCDARGGLPELAHALNEFIAAQIVPSEKIALIGFSMGALIVRYYLQVLGGSTRTVAFFSIAGPHLGTWSARFYPTLGVKQLRRKSEFLDRLNGNTDALKNMPVICYWTPFDIMIRPLSSARWCLGETVCVPALQHSLMLFDQRLHVDIEKRLAAIVA